MSSPRLIKPTLLSYRWFLLFAVPVVSLAFVGCGKVSKDIAPQTSTAKSAEVKKPLPAAVPMWLGNPERTFFGTGPFSDKPLEVAWDFKTGSVRGRLHPDPWGG